MLHGSDRAAVHAAMEGADAIAVTGRPNAQRAMTAEDRAATHEEVLVRTAESVTGSGTPHLVALSAVSVYGDTQTTCPR